MDWILCKRVLSLTATPAKEIASFTVIRCSGDPQVSLRTAFQGPNSSNTPDLDLDLRSSSALAVALLSAFAAFAPSKRKLTLARILQRSPALPYLSSRHLGSHPRRETKLLFSCVRLPGSFNASRHHNPTTRQYSAAAAAVHLFVLQYLELHEVKSKLRGFIVGHAPSPSHEHSRQLSPDEQHRSPSPGMSPRASRRSLPSSRLSPPNTLNIALHRRG